MLVQLEGLRKDAAGAGAEAQAQAQKASALAADLQALQVPSIMHPLWPCIISRYGRRHACRAAYRQYPALHS